MSKFLEVSEKDAQQLQNLLVLLSNMKLELEGGANIIATADCLKWAGQLANRLKEAQPLPEPAPAPKSNKKA
jgi:hypothetical protein